MWEKYRDLSPYQYSANNPLIYKDPTGKIVGTLSGAAVGALVGAISAYSRGENPWQDAIEGGTSGLIAGAAIDITIASGGTGGFLIAGAALGGGLGAFSGDVAGQFYDNMKRKKQDITESLNNVDGWKSLQKVPMGMISGTVSGVVGVTAGRFLKSAANTTDDVLVSASKQIENTASALQKMGASTGTINAATQKMVGGMYKAATNTTNSVVQIEVFVTVTTDASVNTATARINANNLTISGK